MSPETKELFHLALLRVLDANRTRFGLSIPTIGLHLTQFGFSARTCGGVDAFNQSVETEIGYLADKQLVEEVAKPVDRINRAWKLTPAGIAFVDERG